MSRIIVAGRVYEKTSSVLPSFEEVWKLYLDTWPNSLGNAFTFWMEELGSDATEDAAEAKVKEEAEDLYLEAVERLEQAEGGDCWRTMFIPRGVDPSSLDGLGIYWAQEKSGASPYDAPRRTGNDIGVTYRGRVSLDAVDKLRTLWANIDLAVGEEEAEVTFLDNVPIFVHEVEFDEDGSTVPINDWRRT